MSKFIQNLKEKPVAQRKRFAIMCSVIAAGLTFIVCLMVFLSELNAYAKSDEKNAKDEGTLSKVSKSYNAYKKNFDDSDLAQRFDNAGFVQKDLASSTATSTAASTASSTATTSAAN